MVVILNRGGRTWLLRDGKDKEGNPVKRSLPAGASIEALDQAEAEQLLAHKNELVDAEKVMPQVTDKIKALTEKVAVLEAELADYKERLKQYEPDDDPKKGGKKK